MKQFKEGDEVVITGKVIAIDKGGRYPLTVCVAENSEFMCTLDGKNHVDDMTVSVFHLSDIQSQFTDEELDVIRNAMTEVWCSHQIINKINNLFQSPEEKQFLKMAEKFKDKYKMEKI